MINDPTKPFKTINTAILAVHTYLRTLYNQPTPVNGEGIVYAMPGTYGTSAVGGNGESLPIRMRDRVHLQGLGANQCIIRGDPAWISNNSVDPHPVWVPTSSHGGDCNCEFQVLVSFRDASNHSRGNEYPWFNDPYGDTEEMFDGFTLQGGGRNMGEGGGVQILFYSNGEPQAGAVHPAIPQAAPTMPVDYRAKIANCVFDMRTFAAQLSTGSVNIKGPTFGVAMIKRFSGECSQTGAGYQPQDILIANNTFILVEFDGITDQWVNHAEPGAVAILDVTDPGCCTIVEGACTVSGTPTDVDYTNRGVGRAGIINNIFRTAPDSVSPTPLPFAMLGIDRTDTSVISPLLATNCFDPARAMGSTNGAFWSMPVTSVNLNTSAQTPFQERWDCPGTFPSPCHAPPDCGPDTTTYCSAAPDPVAAVPLWNGTSGADPSFVGEALNTFTGSSLAFRVSVAIPQPELYRDWRILPNSPVENAGVPTSVAVQMENGRIYNENNCPTLQISDWDGENYGNAREVGSAPDLGFDEVGLFILTGTYRNDTRSHNEPSSLLNPQPGHPARRRVTENSWAGSRGRLHGWAAHEPHVVDATPGHIEPTCHFGRSCPSGIQPGVHPTDQPATDSYALGGN
jgi:hypothetical protein